MSPFLQRLFIIVCTYTWDPYHAGQGHAESHPLGPLGVDVVVPVLHWRVADAVEDKHGLYGLKENKLKGQFHQNS
jgi:hypothetical protein